ncbi:hypothetical protein LTR46_003195 [Exophiala xenobiotica]|nr:hypothetical protein LTR46_003195 [Exophiala xenobiotica]
MSLSMPEVMPGDGFGLELLTGQANYSKWARGFRIVALSKGLWRVFDSTNQEEHYTIRSTHLETRLAAERGLALLLLWIDPALRPEVENIGPRQSVQPTPSRLREYDRLLESTQIAVPRLHGCGDTEDLESFLYGIVIGLGVKYTQFLQRDDIEVLIEMGDVVTLTGKLLRFETELGIKERANKEVEAEVKSTVVAGSVGAEVKRTVEAKVKAAVEAEVKSAVEAKVKAAVEAEVKSAVGAKVKAAVEAEVKRTVEAKVKSALVAEVKSIVEAAVKSMVEAKKVKAAVEAKGKSTVDTGKDDEADWEQV